MRRRNAVRSVSSGAAPSVDWAGAVQAPCLSRVSFVITFAALSGAADLAALAWRAASAGEGWFCPIAGEHRTKPKDNESSSAIEDRSIAHLEAMLAYSRALSM